MSEADRRHWDRRYAEGGPAPVGTTESPPALGAAADLLPTSGLALVIACGRGREASWLARRGLDPVIGWDVSPVAIDLARDLAEADGVGDRCRFEVADVDHGVPPSPPADLVLCHKFRDPRLDDELVDRLRPGGFLAVACMSEVDAGPGRFREPPGALLDAFGGHDVLHHHEADGFACIVVRKRWTADAASA